MKTFKLLGLLLTYPQESLLAAAEELLRVLRAERLLAAQSIAAIERFLKQSKARDLLELQEEYVATFDRGRAHCLHLFEHIHGESRERGAAMVSLRAAYQEKGLHIAGNELPDYLPLFMEYLSHCGDREARDLLGEAIHVIAAIGARLQARRSPYSDIFAAIETLSAVKPQQAEIAQALANGPNDPQTLDALDQQWKEAAAFGDPPGDDRAADRRACGTSAPRSPSNHSIRVEVRP